MAKITSPAKVNLSLKITGLDQKTGYHFLHSLMSPISIYDEIFVEFSDNFSVITEGVDEDIPTEKNIIYKIFKKTEEFLNKKLPQFSVVIKKNIPTGAGLGGGSSNGAAFLRHINFILNLGMGIDDMCVICSQVGSDIPFFLYQSAAVVEGLGEKITPCKISGIPEDILLIYPDFSVNTKEAYALYDKKILTKLPVININIGRVEKCCSLTEWKQFVQNDFEYPVFEMFQVLSEIKNGLLEENADISFMTGSGSTIVGVFSDAKALDKAFEKWSARYKFVRKAKLLI